MSKLTVANFFDQIIDQLEITSKTRKNYQSAFNCYLRQPLGEVLLDELKKIEIIETTGVLPPPTRYLALMVMRVIYREANDREITESNPVFQIRLPKWESKKREFLTWQEITELDFGKQTQRIQFLALHGLRWGEAAALLPSDCRDGVVHINKSKHGETKTRAGRRVVPQMAPYVEFPAYQNTIARHLKRHGVTVHSLRRTYAYLLKSSNIHVTTAAKLMGHANPMVTLSIYTQVRDDEILTTGQALSELINSLKEKPLIG